MPTAAERQLHLDIVAGAQRLKREIGYNPVRFTQMLGGDWRRRDGQAAAARAVRLGRVHDSVERSPTGCEC